MGCRVTKAAALGEWRAAEAAKAKCSWFQSTSYFVYNFLKFQMTCWSMCYRRGVVLGRYITLINKNSSRMSFWRLWRCPVALSKMRRHFKGSFMQVNISWQIDQRLSLSTQQTNSLWPRPSTSLGDFPSKSCLLWGLEDSQNAIQEGVWFCSLH